jgi:multidrug resistance efflux pump
MKRVKNIFGFFTDPKHRKMIIVVALLVLIISGIFIYLTKQGRVFIDDSLVQAPVINITTASPGNLNEMEVTEGQSVNPGDLLAVVGSQSLRAQTDGLIIQTNKEIGSLISAQSNVVQLINPNDMKVVGTIDENKGLSEIKVGQPVSFTVDAYPGKIYWGFVDEISPTAKQTSLSFSISSERPTQQFLVYARYDAYKYPEIKNGMSAKLTVYTNK